LNLVVNNIEYFVLIKRSFAMELEEMGEEVVEKHPAEELDRIWRKRSQGKLVENQ
jgi:hypothetical protein